MARDFVLTYRGNRWIRRRVGRYAPMGDFTFWVLTGRDIRRMYAKPFQGIQHVETRSLSLRSVPHSGAVLERKELVPVKKVRIADKAAVRHLAALETELLRDHLSVVEHLALLQYEDGSPRQTGYLGVWTQGSQWMARITDKDGDATLTAGGRTLDEALTLLAMLLGADDAPWEPVSRRVSKGARKAS